MNIFWFRRDLRLEDNAALHAALETGETLPVFIFDTNILEDLPDRDDRRVNFIHERVRLLMEELEKAGSALLVFHGKPVEVFKELIETFSVDCVFAGRDYEPYATKRDGQVSKLLKKRDIKLQLIKDHVLYQYDEVLKSDGDPYIIYTPYLRAWKKMLGGSVPESFESEGLLKNLKQRRPARLPSLQSLGFKDVDHGVPDPELDPGRLREYHKHRDYPAENAPTRIGPHIRFGTLSIRSAVAMAIDTNESWLNQLIWREFFIQVLAHFPHSAKKSFREKYDAIPWSRSRKDFSAWCEGRTGFPIVDAGMRQLSETGYMHNRVRMITANFLTRLLLIDWRRGEAWFAVKLLDYEMASNVGGWQWSAGCGCDAAPYFRIFNPDTQLKKFDPKLEYISRWVPEYDTSDYPAPMVDYKEARQRALAVYKTALSGSWP